MRRVKGKKGVVREQHDLIVNIDLVPPLMSSSTKLAFQEFWSLTKEEVADLKEVFMLFDKDEDGVLTYDELEQVMHALGQRPNGVELLLMVKEVSEDQTYNTIEFNEFLQMMSKQMHKKIAPKDLIEAFRFEKFDSEFLEIIVVERIFDKNDTGVISIEELVRVLSKLGLKMKRSEASEYFNSSARIFRGEIEEFLAVAGPTRDGSIDYKGLATSHVTRDTSLLSPDNDSNL